MPPKVAELGLGELDLGFASGAGSEVDLGELEGAARVVAEIKVDRVAGACFGEESDFASPQKDLCYGPADFGRETAWIDENFCKHSP